MAATFVCPLDVIKTRLQVHGLPPGSIIITSLQNIVKKEGLKGMYRGLSPTILALLPNWAVNDRDSQLSTGANMIAAAGAGAATAISTNPLWVVKTRLQTQGMRTDVVPYKGVLSALTRITYEEGIRGLYSGILPSLVGVSHVAIQFPAYEKIKHYMAKKGKMLLIVIRSRLQEQGQARNSVTQYAGVVDCIKKVFLKEGIAGFYRGCATNLLRTTPSAVITFTSYEMIHRFLQQIILPEENL
ncbi:hypothetical protein CRG98_038402 [Punica granatum]|uniref:Nicotinamide adenine dinucleotide transporter 1, chloroplastic-like n=1 Tax=Punica granatum TaxID=22663 RepID=A0A2I0IB34_PUNGR|nr:hypothetical protein CRG98_038402 [Punica granatum]